MFGKTNGNHEMDDHSLSIVASETFFQGTVRTHGSIRIDGKIEGNIHDAKQVVIGDQGQVQGDVVAESVVIGGKVTGNIQASKLVQILGKGQVFGDIRTKSLHIEDGAVFEGTCTMNAEETPGVNNLEGSDSLSKSLDNKKSRLQTPLIK